MFSRRAVVIACVIWKKAARQFESMERVRLVIFTIGLFGRSLPPFLLARTDAVLGSIFCANTVAHLYYTWFSAKLFLSLYLPAL